MENSMTRISDLPNDVSAVPPASLATPPIQNNNMIPPETISISNMKNKTEHESVNYNPMNPHNNMSPSNNIIAPVQQTNSQPLISLPNDNIQIQKPNSGGMPEEFRQQFENNIPSQKLPSRDIPNNTENYNMDARVQPNYIPKPNTNDYVREHHDMTEQNLRDYESKKYRMNKLDSFLTEFQLPIFVALLFFFFQLPIVNTMIFKKFTFLHIYNEDGNFNFYGLVLKSILFGLFYLFVDKSIYFVSAL